MLESGSDTQVWLGVDEVVSRLDLDVVQNAGNRAQERALASLVPAVDDMKIWAPGWKRQRSIRKVAVGQ